MCCSDTLKTKAKHNFLQKLPTNLTWSLRGKELVSKIDKNIYLGN